MVGEKKTGVAKLFNEKGEFKISNGVLVFFFVLFEVLVFGLILFLAYQAESGLIAFVAIIYGTFAMYAAVKFSVTLPKKIKAWKSSIDAEEKRKKEARKECIRLVKKAKEMNVNVDENNISKSRHDLEIINNNYIHLSDHSDVVNAYSLGLEYMEIEKVENAEKRKRAAEKRKQTIEKKKKEKHNEYINGLEEIINNQNEVANLEGKDKYLDVLKQNYEKTEAERKKLAEARATAIQLIGIIAASGGSTSNIKPQPDWKTSALAGAATAIGGPLAGMMVVSDAMVQNTKARNNTYNEEEALKQRSQWINDNLQPVIEKANKEMGSLSGASIKRKIDSFDLLIDTGYVSEKTENITSEVKDYQIITSYEMNVDVEISVNEVEILGKSAIIDGSISIIVYDGETKVASGILSAPGYGITDIDGIGFRNETYRVICFSPKGLLNNNADIRIITTPINLWYIENRKIWFRLLSEKEN